MNFGRVITADCVDALPPPDARCSDPAFAIANPDLCGVQTRLILKPGTALLCELNSIQFQAFTVRGGIETDVTDDTIFTSGDLNIVVIGAISGNATGLIPGEATITATYGEFTATAQVVVLAGDDCCTAQSVAFMVVADATKSMIQGFGGGYATRLSFLQAAANQFIGEIDTLKDTVGLITFHGTTVTTEDALGAAAAAVQADVSAILPTNDKTEFYDALTAAIAALNASAADRKVLVLYSDGDDTLTASFDATNDPLIILNDFKAAGGIVMCMGVRASGDGFALLSAMATGGFFINAYPDSADDALAYFSGLKGYICGGNCTPAGDELVATGQLNYDDFINWDVVDGTLDILGNGFLDFLPGNGLYVDMLGSTLPQTGRLLSATPFTLENGHEYRIKVRVAGNQRTDQGAQTLRVRVIPESGAPNLLDQGIGIASYAQDFQEFSLSFTAPADMDIRLSLNQVEWPAGLARSMGLLLDRVIFEDVTDGDLKLSDNFDSEHIEYVPPGCGSGTTWTWLTDLNQYGYAVGYDCYGEGCLDAPPAAQLPDPNPLPDIESGPSGPAKVYTSTRTVCVSCPVDSENGGTPLIPNMTSNTTPSGEASASSIQAVGNDAWHALADSAAPLLNTPWVSEDGMPQWLQYKFDAAVIAYGYFLYGLCNLGFAPTAWILQGSNDGVAWTDLDTQLACTSNEVLPIATPGAYTYYRVYITAAEETSGLANVVQVFAFQLFGEAVQQACATATAVSYTSQAQADTDAEDQAREDAQALLFCQHVYTSTQQYTAHCPLGCFGYDVTATATATSVISQQAADDEAYAAAKASAEADLDCGSSNNEHAISIPDADLSTLLYGVASPYPSVKKVSGLTGTITKVTVLIQGLNHIYAGDLLMVLRSPGGTNVILMQNAGQNVNAVVDANLVFDDDFAPIGEFAWVISGSYAPSSYAPDKSLSAPADASPYATTLAQLFGEDPNGCWSLWVCDTQAWPAHLVLHAVGSITNGWDLSITSA